jgi:hypothetical protein
MAVIPFSPTVHAGPWQITDVGVGKGFPIGQLIDPHPGDAVFFVGFIFFKWNVIFRHARHHAGPAAGALVQVNHHSKFMRISVILLCHQNLSNNLSTSFVENRLSLFKTNVFMALLQESLLENFCFRNVIRLWRSLPGFPRQHPDRIWHP